MKLYKWHIEFSKIAVVVCFLLFIWVFITDIKMLNTSTITSTVVTFCTTTITVSGAILTTALGFYFNKSKTKNNLDAQYEWLKKEYEFKAEHPEVFGKLTPNDFNNATTNINNAFINKQNADTVSAISETIK